MSHRVERRSGARGIQMLLCSIGCAGFAIAWWRSSAGSPGAPALSGDLPARASVARATAARVASPAAAPAVVDGTVAGLAAAPDATEIRASQLPEWMRFRHAHPHLALSTEAAVRHALDAASSLHDAVTACAARERGASVRWLELSAAIAIDGREVTAQGWGCEASGDPDAAARICDCIVEHLPTECHTAVPAQVADEDLVPYDGMLSLRLHP